MLSKNYTQECARIPRCRSSASRLYVSLKFPSTPSDFHPNWMGLYFDSIIPWTWCSKKNSSIRADTSWHCRICCIQGSSTDGVSTSTLRTQKSSTRHSVTSFRTGLSGDCGSADAGLLTSVSLPLREAGTTDQYLSMSRGCASHPKTASNAIPFASYSSTNHFVL